MAYIGRNPACGCVQFATVDRPERQRENAKEIAKLIRDGWSVERMTGEQVRQDLCLKRHKKGSCPCREEATHAAP